MKDIFLFVLILLTSVIIYFAIAGGVVYIILWLINKLLLNDSIKKVRRLQLSLIIPLVCLCAAIAFYYWLPYSTTKMDKRLEKFGIEFKLPQYKITNYTRSRGGCFNYEDEYTITFKDKNVRLLVPKLDSLCVVNSNWKKDGNGFVYVLTYEEIGDYEMFSINPFKGTAKYVYHDGSLYRPAYIISDKR